MHRHRLLYTAGRRAAPPAFLLALLLLGLLLLPLAAPASVVTAASVATTAPASVATTAPASVAVAAPGAATAAGGAAAPAPSSLTATQAARVLQAYGIVDDRPLSELRLDDPISRAEVAKVLGAALKAQDRAADHQAVPAFPDTADHWANGWVQVARQAGLFQGRPDGRFHPQDPVTYAEALTALLRLIGRSEAAATNWPWGAITHALELELLPLDMDLAGRWHEPAPRGAVFRLAAIAGRVPVAGTDRSLFQTLHDQSPPALALTGFPAVTAQQQLAVTGTAGDAVAVLVAGRPAALADDGSFSAPVILQAGDNRISVVAWDGAGNRAETAAHIAYEPVARLELEPTAIRTAVNQTFTVAAMQVDRHGGRTTVSDVTWAYDTSALEYDARTGGFKALKPGAFTLQATAAGLESSATVTVAGPPDRIELVADQDTVAAGSPPVAIRFRILDAHGRPHAARLQVQFTVVPQGAATLDLTAVSPETGEGTVYLAPGANPGGIGVQARVPAVRGLESPVLPIQVEPRRLAGVRLTASPAYLPPAAGHNVTVSATAVDQSGAPIPVSEDLTVSLRLDSAAAAQLTGAVAVIPAGASSSDAGGKNGTLVTTGAAGEVQVRGSAPVPVTPVTVTVAAARETARLDVRVTQGGAFADGLSAALVTVTRRDDAGAVVTHDSAPVVLLSGRTGVSVSTLSDEGGVATFAVRTSTAGRVALTAGIPGRPELNSSPVEVAFLRAMGAAARPVIQVAAPEVRAGEPVPVQVALQASGKAAQNPGPRLTVHLSADGGRLEQSEVHIQPGATHSNTVLLYVPPDAKQIKLTGSVAGGQALPPLTASVKAAAGGGAGPVVVGPTLVAVGPTGGRQPLAGEDTRFVIQARDGDDIRAGAYAFTIRVRRDGQELTELPADLQVTLGGKSIENIVGRTAQGLAEVYVRYIGTGKIEIEPVPHPASGVAYDQWGVQGYARGTVGDNVVAAAVTYVAGPLDHLAISVSPSLGNSLHSVIGAAPGRSATVTVRPVDAYGNNVGSGCVVRLARTGGGSGSGRGVTGGAAGDSGGDADVGLAIRSGQADLAEYTQAVDASGAATFTVVSTDGTVAWSEWQAAAVCGSTTLVGSQRVRVDTAAGGTFTPVLSFVGGDVTGDGEVRAADSVLRVTIAQISGTAAAVELLLYDDETFLGRFGPVFPGHADPARRTISVPKSLLGAYSRQVPLQVRVHTGVDTGAASETRWISYHTGP